MRLIDFAIASTVFIMTLASVIGFVARQMTSLQDVTSLSDAKKTAHEYFTTLFESKGTPTNWEVGKNPEVVGLMSDLYRIPIVVKEASGTQRTNVTINVSISFDIECKLKAWNTTVRVYEGAMELPFQLYNQTYCTSQYLNSSNVFFNATFSANQNKTFFIYFSNETSVEGVSYSVPFVNVSNFTVQIYPEEKILAISPSKMEALRQLEYEDVVTTLGKADFEVEVSE